MSYKHPSVQQVLNCSVSLTNNHRIRKYLSNSSLNLAKYKFYALFKRDATLDDSQTLYNIYEVQWERIHTKKNGLDRIKSVYKWANTYFKLMLVVKLLFFLFRSLFFLVKKSKLNF